MDVASTDQSHATSPALSTPTLVSSTTLPPEVLEAPLARACEVTDLYAVTDSESPAEDGVSTLYFDCLRRSDLSGLSIDSIGGAPALTIEPHLRRP